MNGLIIPGKTEEVRKDCTVIVDCIQAYGRNFSPSYIDWNLPKHQRAILKILQANGGQIHIQDFMKRWEALPMEEKI